MSLQSHWPEHANPVTQYAEAGYDLKHPLDARRCTVQLSSGRLYLDAVASAETSLLGHDSPSLPATDESIVREMLSSLAPGFICVGTLRDLSEAAEHASSLARSGVGPNGHVIKTNAAEGEPARSDGMLVVSENESLGRTGRWLSSSTWETKPDLVVVGEALALGLPFGAVLAGSRFATAAARERVWPEVTHRATTTALSRVAAAITAVESDGLLQHGQELAEYLASRILPMQESCPQIASIDSTGLLIRIAFTPPLKATTVRKWMCERGVLVGVDKVGRLAIDPPLPLRIAEADVITGALRGALLGLPMVSAPACCYACEESD